MAGNSCTKSYANLCRSVPCTSYMLAAHEAKRWIRWYEQTCSSFALVSVLELDRVAITYYIYKEVSATAGHRSPSDGVQLKYLHGFP